MKFFALILLISLNGELAFAQPNTEATVIVKQASETLEQINQGPQYKTMRKSVSLFANTNPPVVDQKKNSDSETK